jgi:hypothetical protein
MFFTDDKMKSVVNYFFLGAFLCASLNATFAQSPVPQLAGLSAGDTLYLNFSISSGEFGMHHKGILIYKDQSKDEILAKYVLYNYGITRSPKNLIMVSPKAVFTSLNADTIFNLYNRIKADYTVIKKPWLLQPVEVAYLQAYVGDMYRYKSNGWSNAPDVYAMFSKSQRILVVDTVGQWNVLALIRKSLRL